MINFTKMHGLGNDFVVIDAINQNISLSSEQICFMSDRHFGIGFDQLLLVEAATDDQVDFTYRIFNADGSEVAQCGNGARCFARFVRDKHLCDKEEIRVSTNSGILILCFEDDGMITVNMGIPKHKPAEIPILAAEESKFYSVDMVEERRQVDNFSHHVSQRAFGAVSMGNPHAVMQVHDIKTAYVLSIGAQLENHSVFPERANIGFMQVIDQQHIKLRVYERGAGETLACGSGACAAVVIGIEQHLLASDVLVELPGGSLKIHWSGRGQPVFMTGPATSIYDGSITL